MHIPHPYCAQGHLSHRGQFDLCRTSEYTPGLRLASTRSNRDGFDRMVRHVIWVYATSRDGAEEMVSFFFISPTSAAAGPI